MRAAIWFHLSRLCWALGMQRAYGACHTRWLAAHCRDYPL